MHGIVNQKVTGILCVINHKKNKCYTNFELSTKHKL